MTTYICKCGRTFTKNTEAGTTGFRMPDYGPVHECYGCPFVCGVLTWDPVKDQTVTKNHECRGSKTIRYDTTAGISTTDKLSANICTLDFNFLRQIHEFAESLDGFSPDVGFFYNGLSCYGADGRYRYPLYPLQNQKGLAAKVALKERFFNLDGTRKDVTPEQEKEIVLEQIRKAKEEAQSVNTYYAPCGHKFNRSAGGASEITIEVTGSDQGCAVCRHVQKELRTIAEGGPCLLCVCSRKKVAPADTPSMTLADVVTAGQSAAEESISRPGVRYLHHGLVYSARLREDNGLYTVFMDDAAHPGPDTLTPVATIPDFETFVEAQDALDELALKRGFTAEGSAPAEVPEAGPENEVPEIENAAAPSGDSSEDFENDDVGQPEQAEEMNELAGQDDVGPAEQPPCDWKNASGSDDDEEDEPAEENPSLENNIPAGEPVSLRDTAFEDLLDACDSKINAALRVAVETKQGFTFNSKVTFDFRGGSFAVKHETGYQFDPIKVKDKSELHEEIQIVLDRDGNPIIPYNRQHQLNFDELQPGREIPPSGGTVTVDGKTGIVEDYREDGAEDQDAGDTAGEPQGDEPAEKLYPCENFDCPFYGLPDDGDGGCCYDQDARDARDPSIKSNIADAVRFYRCTRPEIIQTFAEDHPGEDDSSTREPDAEPDGLPYPDDSDGPQDNNSLHFMDASDF